MKKPMVFLLIAVFLLFLAGCGNQAATIGIIGGADGPTAIFVTSGTNWLNLWSLTGIIVVIILVALFLWRRKK